MPQNNGKFGSWSALVTIYDNYITERLPEVDSRGLNHGIYLPHGYNYKNWTKEDLTNLATTYNGVGMFETLILLKNAAGAEAPTDKLSAKDIQDAQKALEYLKPDSCKDWVDFGKMIHAIQKSTLSQRAELNARQEKAKHKSGALIDLTKFDNIAGDPMDNPEFDQQKALNQLDKNNVKMDSEHTLKSPDPKAVALDAVKAIKGAVRAA